MLEGSVRKAGSRVRITTQLLDATTGAHLWTDHFDGSLDDVFELQDKVASSVPGVIEPTLQVAEYRRATQRPTHDLTAYDLFLQARLAYDRADGEGVMRAIELVERALERDPNYGSALAVRICERLGVKFSARAAVLTAPDALGFMSAVPTITDMPAVLATTYACMGRFLSRVPAGGLSNHFHVSFLVRSGSPVSSPRPTIK